MQGKRAYSGLKGSSLGKMREKPGGLNENSRKICKKEMGLGGGWRRFTESVGKTVKFWEGAESVTALLQTAEKSKFLFIS